MNAERFRIANLTLRQHPNPQVMLAVGTPALVLSAFASELYLKCLIAIESDRAAYGHELRTLFRSVSKQTQANIERRWNMYVTSPQRHQHYAALASLVGYTVPTDLDWTLKNGGSGFVELRYIHESNDGTKFLLGDFPEILRAELLLRKPEWSDRIHGPLRTIPGFEGSANGAIP